MTPHAAPWPPSKLTPSGALIFSACAHSRSSAGTLSRVGRPPSLELMTRALPPGLASGDHVEEAEDVRDRRAVEVAEQVAIAPREALVVAERVRRVDAGAHDPHIAQSAR